MIYVVSVITVGGKEIEGGDWVVSRFANAPESYELFDRKPR